MKILVTGCAGLLGNHFIRHLLDNNYNVFGIDNLSGGYMDYVDQRLVESEKRDVRFSYIDLLDKENLENIFNYYKPDYVYHFAAYAALGLSPYIRNYNYTNNILASVNLINESIKHDVKKFIFASSMDVYGNQKPPFTEDMTPQPEDPYGIAKYAIEMDLKNAYEQFGLNYSIIRPHNVVGIYQNIWDKYRNVIGIWIRRILNGEPMLIYGDGKQRRAFSDVKYYMKPFELLMDKCNNDVINIGADNDFEIIQIASWLREISKDFGYYPDIEFREERHEVKNAFCDHSKAKNLLNFKDNTDIYKLMEEMFEWAVNQPKREVKEFDYEIDKNIYSYWK